MKFVYLFLLSCWWFLGLCLWRCLCSVPFFTFWLRNQQSILPWIHCNFGCLFGVDLYWKRQLLRWNHQFVALVSFYIPALFFEAWSERRRFYSAGYTQLLQDLFVLILEFWNWSAQRNANFGEKNDVENLSITVPVMPAILRWVNDIVCMLADSRTCNMI